MADPRMPGAPYRSNRLQGAGPASAGRSGARSQRQCRRGARVAIAGQAWACGADPQLARFGLSAGRSEVRVSSSISRQLVLWLAVPLMLLSLCGALVHYFNSVAPGVINSDRRLKEAAGALMAHVQVKDGQVGLDAHSATQPHLPPPDSVDYVLRDSRGRLLAGDAGLATAALSGETSQLIAMTQVDHHPVRSLTTRFDTSAGVILITVADVRPVAERAARYGFMSTLLWDFVQLDVTLVLVWVGIQLGLRPVRKLREEIAARSPQDLRPIVETTVPREIAPVVVTLNRLFTTLRSSEQSQQKFIANTAHQLRTPITGLQAQLDLLLA